MCIRDREQAAAPAFDEEKWERARKARDKRFRVLQELSLIHI